MIPVNNGIGDIHSDIKGSGARFNANKPDYSLVPLGLMVDTICQAGVAGATNNTLMALRCLAFFQETHEPQHLYDVIIHLGLSGWQECADVFTYGKAKYAAWNWAKGMSWSVPLACATRHLLAMIDGLELDTESGLPHRGHVFCNIVMLLTYMNNYPEGNDLPIAGLFGTKPANGT